MACRRCSAGFGQLPQRLAAPLRHSIILDTSRSSASSICAGATTTTAAAAANNPLPSSPLRLNPRRALHTTAPRQQTGWKQALLGRVAQTLIPGKSTYYIYGVTERISKACAAQADYTIDAKDRKAGTLKTTADGEEIGVSKGGPWHSEIGLLPTFSTWAHVTMLHMYLLVVRFRCLDFDAQQAWQAQLVNHFFFQAEAKMDEVHELTSRTIRQRYLKDLFVQWRGLILAYDEGIVKGDAVLAEALWRNLFKAREDVDVRALAAVVAWMRASLEHLGQLSDHAIELVDEDTFPELAAQFRTVDQPTAALKAAFY
ncbi:2e124491-5df7-4d5b-a235-31ad9d5ec7b2 [Thermothielavioides terrestris]|uniref:2e124491-5df7-4d5b-a235-31ad9d5ec7b2 n=1 Tax=Thermothielavioides terrestris TaxID=2587410 RepID=A0A3S4EYA6_9PEZI|nr:2e124491-5df7-4d5b-a235-31ad9d5ec7b2 [Thermothielavioides terrestris]